MYVYAYIYVSIYTYIYLWQSWYQLSKSDVFNGFLVLTQMFPQCSVLDPNTLNIINIRWKSRNKPVHFDISAQFKIKKIKQILFHSQLWVCVVLEIKSPLSAIWFISLHGSMSIPFYCYKVIVNTKYSQYQRYKGVIKSRPYFIESGLWLHWLRQIWGIWWCCVFWFV